MDKIAFEMRADERSLTRLEQALDFAVAELSEGFEASKIYDTEEGNKLMREVEDDIHNLCDKVTRLKELATYGLED